MEDNMEVRQAQGALFTALDAYVAAQVRGDRDTQRSRVEQALAEYVDARIQQAFHELARELEAR